MPFGDSGRLLLQLRQSLCPQGWLQLLPNSTSSLKQSHPAHTFFLFSLVKWDDGAGYPTTDAVVGAIWVATSIGLVAWPSHQILHFGFGWKDCGVLFWWRVCKLGRVDPTSSAVGRAIGLTSRVSSSGGCWNNEGVVSHAPWASAEPDFMLLMSVVVGWVMGCPWRTAGSWFTVSRATFPRPQRMSHL